jgi:hypothetical protein
VRTIAAPAIARADVEGLNAVTLACGARAAFEVRGG